MHACAAAQTPTPTNTHPRTHSRTSMTLSTRGWSMSLLSARRSRRMMSKSCSRSFLGMPVARSSSLSSTKTDTCRRHAASGPCAVDDAPKQKKKAPTLTASPLLPLPLAVAW